MLSEYTNKGSQAVANNYNKGSLELTGMGMRLTLNIHLHFYRPTYAPSTIQHKLNVLFLQMSPLAITLGFKLTVLYIHQL
jgi:hypothetical protein